MNLEQQLKEKTRELHDMHARYESDKNKMHDLLVANERMRAHISEREREMAAHGVADMSPSELRNARESQKEIELLYARLRDIAQAVYADEQQAANDGSNGDIPLASCPSPRSRSPVKRGGGGAGSRSGSPFADSTLIAVQAAISKRQLQIHDLKSKLDVSRDSLLACKKQLDESDAERRKLEASVNDYRLQSEGAKRVADEACRERDFRQQQLEATIYEKANLEKARVAMASQAEALRVECDKLQSANNELQRNRDQLEDEKDDIIKDKMRQVKENERCYKTIEQLEMKISALKKELTDTKESLNRTRLERDVILQDKSVTSDALGRAEILNSELEVELSNMKTEESKLRDDLCKLQAHNDNLNQDKSELNRIIAHLEQQKAELMGEKADLDLIKSSLKGELVKVEREKQDLENERESEPLFPYHH